jgi:glycine/D-amino acid oxidase-like deaminating enzyme
MPTKPLSTTVFPDSAAALADARPIPLWLDLHPAPEPRSTVTGTLNAELLVIGGGYTGLWTALQAKESDPSLDVVLVDADVCGQAASGRNGGFCAASLTHGIDNGLSRFGDEMPTLERLGLANLDEIEKTVLRRGIDCDFRRSGELDVATQPWQVAELRSAATKARELGHDVEWLDGEQLRAEVRSPGYLGGLWLRDAVAMLDPALLAQGLRRACLDLGVRIHEHSPVRSLTDHGTQVSARCDFGTVRASRIMLATNGFTPLIKRLRNYVVPVYDYALATEPLTSGQLESLGWHERQGIGDAANQFHYYRLTADNRILWGGYDTIYHYGSPVRAELMGRPATHATLAAHFFETFPQLQGIRFTHRWGGMIDTCTRFCPFFGTALDGKVGYAVGFTGLGVGSSRFAAATVLDLLWGRDTERTRLRMVRTRPLPLPPEPLRWLGIQLTRWSLDRADRNGGKRNLWLRALDKAGMGFGS